MSRRPPDTWCTQTLEPGRGVISEVSQAATGAHASTLSLESPLIPFCITCQHFPSPCFPAFKSLSLCWFGCSRWLSNAEMKAPLPTPAQGQRVGFASCFLCTHIDRRWGGHIYSPREIRVSSVAHECSLVCPWGLPPRHSGVCPSASTRVCSWCQCRAPTHDPGLSTSRRVQVKNACAYTVYNCENSCLTSLTDQ